MVIVLFVLEILLVAKFTVKAFFQIFQTFFDCFFLVLRSLKTKHFMIENCTENLALNGDYIPSVFPAITNYSAAMVLYRL